MKKLFILKIILCILCLFQGPGCVLDWSAGWPGAGDSGDASRREAAADRPRIEAKVGDRGQDQLVTFPPGYLLHGQGTGYSWLSDLVAGPSGSIFVVGSFTDTFQLGAKTLKSTGDYDLFLCKIESTGVVSFCFSAGGPGRDRATSIDITPDNKLWVVGDFEGNIKFGSVSFVGTSDIDMNPFVARFSSAGTLEKAMQGSSIGSSKDNGRDVLVGPSGHVYVTGTFINQLTFAGKEFTGSTADVISVYILKLDSNGIGQWGLSLVADKACSGDGLAVDKWGNLFFVGSYQGGLKVGGETLPTSATRDIFMLRLDENGQVKKSQAFVGLSGSDEPRGIYADGNGGVFFSGFFVQKLQFGSQALTSSAPAGIQDMFVAHLKTDLSLDWALAASTSGGGSTDRMDLYNGRMAVAGRHKSTFAAGKTVLTSAGQEDALVMVMTVAGQVVFMTSGGGTLQDYAIAAAWDRQGGLVLGGAFTQGATFGGKAISGPFQHLFVWKQPAPP